MKHEKVKIGVIKGGVVIMDLDGNPLREVKRLESANATAEAISQAIKEIRGLL